jgi:hypothetical protein
LSVCLRTLTVGPLLLPGISRMHDGDAGLADVGSNCSNAVIRRAAQAVALDLERAGALGEALVGGPRAGLGKRVRQRPARAGSAGAQELLAFVFLQQAQHLFGLGKAIGVEQQLRERRVGALLVGQERLACLSIELAERLAHSLHGVHSALAVEDRGGLATVDGRQALQRGQRAALTLGIVEHGGEHGRATVCVAGAAQVARALAVGRFGDQPLLRCFGIVAGPLVERFGTCADSSLRPHGDGFAGRRAAQCNGAGLMAVPARRRGGGALRAAQLLGGEIGLPDLAIEREQLAVHELRAGLARPLRHLIERLLEVRLGLRVLTQMGGEIGLVQQRPDGPGKGRLLLGVRADRVELRLDVAADRAHVDAEPAQPRGHHRRTGSALRRCRHA